MPLPTAKQVRALLLAAPLLITAGAAFAQAPAPPAWPTDPRPAAPQAAPGPWPGQPQQAPQPQEPIRPMMPMTPMAPMAAPQQEPPCIKEFVALRGEAQKKGEAIQAASKRKATPAEACSLFNIFVATERKLVKYAEANAAQCGIPPDALVQLQKNHKQSQDVRVRVCEAAAQMKNRPSGPSLSDALGGRAVPDASNVKRGHGTFDTLTGTPLGR